MNKAIKIDLSFPQKRGYILCSTKWIPAFAGMTKQICLIALLGIVGLYPAFATTPDICKDKSYTPVAEQKLDSVFYLVTDCKGNESYILGTLHSSDAEIVNAVAFATPYLASTKSAWFELEKHPDDEVVAAQRMYFPASQKDGLKSMIGDGDFNKMVTLFRSHAPHVQEAFLDRFQPWAAAIALQILTIDTSGVVLDDVLQNEAKKQGITVNGLETVENQFDIFEKFSKDEQISMLRDAIRLFEDNKKMSDRLIELYKKGDLRQIADLSEETFISMADGAIAEKLEQWLVFERNEKMAQILVAELAKGHRFIAIGALHLPGETGMLQSFEKAEYRIGAIKPE